MEDVDTFKTDMGKIKIGTINGGCAVSINGNDIITVQSFFIPKMNGFPMQSKISLCKDDGTVEVLNNLEPKHQQLIIASLEKHNATHLQDNPRGPRRVGNRHPFMQPVPVFYVMYPCYM